MFNLLKCPSLVLKLQFRSVATNQVGQLSLVTVSLLTIKKDDLDNLSGIRAHILRSVNSEPWCMELSRCQMLHDQTRQGEYNGP